MSLGLLLKTPETFQKLPLKPGIDIVSPDAINFYDPAYWVNESHRESMWIFDLDAYGDLMDPGPEMDPTRRGVDLKVYRERMESVHHGLFEEVWREGGQQLGDRRFKHLPLPGEARVELGVLGEGREQEFERTRSAGEAERARHVELAKELEVQEGGDGDEVSQTPPTPTNRRSWQRRKLSVISDLSSTLKVLPRQRLVPARRPPVGD